MHSKIVPSLLVVSDSSSRALESLRGMEVHVKALCATWSDQITSCFRLSRIEWYREKTGAHHEYLIANVRNESDTTQDTKGLWLRLERRPKTGFELERKRDYFTRLIGHFEADDVVTISRQKEHLLHRDDMQAELQATMRFHEKVSLRYIMEVLKIIHEESPSYHLAGVSALCPCFGSYNSQRCC
jgi:hypothetical protein